MTVIENMLYLNLTRFDRNDKIKIRIRFERKYPVAKITRFLQIFIFISFIALYDYYL